MPSSGIKKLDKKEFIGYLVPVNAPNVALMDKQDKVRDIVISISVELIIDNPMNMTPEILLADCVLSHADDTPG